MTTIAYKDGILAADTQLVIDSTKLYCTKIRILRKDFIIACAGDVDLEYKAHLFFSDPNWRKNPIPTIEKKQEFRCIFLEKNTPYFCHTSFVPVPLEHPFYSIGSGQDFALLAMQIGFSAIQAVMFASSLDINTNNEPEIYDTKLQKIIRREELKEALKREGYDTSQDFLPIQKEVN